MKRKSEAADQSGRERRLPLVVTAAVIALLGGIILFGAGHLRQNVRAQILHRDAQVLHAIALAQQIRDESEAALGGQIEDFADQFALALHISRVRGVIAARMFDAQGRLLATFPEHVVEAELTPSDMVSLRVLRPVSRYHPDARLSTVFRSQSPASGTSEPGFPLLEVTIPFHRAEQTNLLGAVQFVMDGRGIAAEFAVLDRYVFAQAVAVFVGAGLLVGLALGWAFQRLQVANRQLAERTVSLSRANEELAMAARTSAVGAIAAHLIHSLSSPLAGLQNFMANGNRNPEPSDPDWQQARQLTRKMQETIAAVVRVLREQQGEAHYTVSLAELGELVARRMETVAQQAGVTLRVECVGDGELSNRETNLVLFILENLLKNALEATPTGKVVALSMRRVDDRVEFAVRDHGPGIPEELRARLFQPCRSTKAGGSGIGLAISKQLANHLGAELELTHSSAAGSEFHLRLPLAARGCSALGRTMPATNPVGAG